MQLGPLSDGSEHFVGRTTQEIADHQRLGSRHAGAKFGADVAQADAPVAAELDAGHGRFGAGAEVFLADGKASAVPVIRVAGLAPLLASITITPAFVLRRLVEDFVQAQCTGWHRTLGILHARLQGIVAPQVNGIDAQAAGHFVHHHLGGGHALQGAVPAHGAGFHCPRMIGSDCQIVLRHVVDRLGSGSAYGCNGGAVVNATTAVTAHVGAEDLEAVVLLVHRQLVTDVEGVALDAALELLVAVVGQAHWHALAVQRCHGGVEDEDVVVLGAVANGVAWVHVQVLEAKA